MLAISGAPLLAVLNQPAANGLGVVAQMAAHLERRRAHAQVTPPMQCRHRHTQELRYLRCCPETITDRFG